MRTVDVKSPRHSFERARARKRRQASDRERIYGQSSRHRPNCLQSRIIGNFPPSRAGIGEEAAGKNGGKNGGRPDLRDFPLISAQVNPRRSGCPSFRPPRRSPGGKLPPTSRAIPRPNSHETALSTTTGGGRTGCCMYAAQYWSFLTVGAADLCYSCSECIYAEEHATHRNGRGRFSIVLVACNYSAQS